MGAASVGGMLTGPRSGERAGRRALEEEELDGGRPLLLSLEGEGEGEGERAGVCVCVCAAAAASLVLSLEAPALSRLSSLLIALRTRSMA
jgi:hypothetical protein